MKSEVLKEEDKKLILNSPTRYNEYIFSSSLNVNCSITLRGANKSSAYKRNVFWTKHLFVNIKTELPE